MITEDILRQVVTDVINQELSDKFWLYIFLLCLFFLITLICTYFVTHIKKRAELEAIESQFDEILRQVKVTTEATADINSRVDKLYQHELDMKHIKREKLEQLFEYDVDVMNYLNEYTKSIATKGEDIDKVSPIRKMETILRLYFPDASKEYTKYSEQYLKIYLYFNELLQKNFKKQIDMLTETDGRINAPEINDCINTLLEYNKQLTELMRLSNHLKDTLFEKYSVELGMKSQPDDQPH